MVFKLIERNTVAVPVKGEIADESGKTERFDFSLLCRRLGADALSEQLKDSERSIKAFMLDVTEGWRNVADADGNPVPFSESHLDELLETPGMAQLAFQCYLKEQAVKAKN